MVGLRPEQRVDDVATLSHYGRYTLRTLAVDDGRPPGICWVRRAASKLTSWHWLSNVRLCRRPSTSTSRIRKRVSTIPGVEPQAKHCRPAGSESGPSALSEFLNWLKTKTLLVTSHQG